MSESKVLKRQTSTVSSLTCILKKGWSTFESSFSNLVHSVESTGCLKIIGYFNAIDICDCCPRARRWLQLLWRKIWIQEQGARCFMAHGAWLAHVTIIHFPTLLTAPPLKQPLFSYLTGSWGGSEQVTFMLVASGQNTKAPSYKFRSGASTLIVSKSSISSRRQLINDKCFDKIPHDLSNKCELAALFYGFL